MFYLASTRMVAVWLMEPLENGMRLVSNPKADAIVILGGGKREQSEYNGETMLSEGSGLRLQYGSWLAKQTHLPVLVTGGSPEMQGEAEARVMEKTMLNFYDSSPRWVEDQSKTTEENALYSAPLLKKAGINTIVLVSHGWHLPRAIPLFEKAGFKVIPAGVDFTYAYTPTIRNWVPSARNLERTSWAMHEWMGRIWYALKPAAKPVETPSP
ncbi:YdcF family protein [Leeia sp. TBRC 13508]|uniref:YdcF family protein n=1 Tax=Leeia speluncae TaxID=2884804 RepID=A0ABS8D332_9NEIS|nr:YdcF family protein [Leeia speluncae]MCB6182611.1 YdcF family protein [Leeia speluncae]